MKMGVIGFIICLLASTASAQAPKFALPRPAFHFLWQNDSWGSDSDRFFTNGLELGLTVSADLDSLDWLPFRKQPTAATHVFALGQDMFTPEDFVTTTPDPRDRPYAGWLHASYRNEALTLGPERRDHLDIWELELGVVGPSSLAEDVQIRVHEMVGAQRPGGWGSQLRDEPGVLVGYERRYRTWFNDTVLNPLESDLVGALGFRLGNVETSFRLGTTFRVGLNLPRHLGSALRPTTGPQHRLHLEAGVEGRVVFHNIFLDGNSWRASPSVDRGLFVADFHVGVVWELTRNLRASLVETFRTPEFDRPSSSSDLARFTSISVVYRF